MIVNISGNEPFSFSIESYDQITYSDLGNIVQLSLANYNSAFNTNFSINDVTFSLVDQQGYEVEGVTESDLRNKNYQINVELSVKNCLENNIINCNDAYKLSEKIRDCFYKEDYHTANILLNYVFDEGCIPYSKRIKADKHPKTDFLDKLLSDNHDSEENYIKNVLLLCRKFSFSEVHFFHIISNLSKKYPKLAVFVLFNYPNYIHLLPYITVNEEAFQYALRRIQSVCYSSKLQFDFAFLFAEKGCIKNAFKVGFNFVNLCSMNDKDLHKLIWLCISAHEIEILHQLFKLLLMNNESIIPNKFKNIYSNALNNSAVSDKVNFITSTEDKSIFTDTRYRHFFGIFLSMGIFLHYINSYIGFQIIYNQAKNKEDILRQNDYLELNILLRYGYFLENRIHLETNPLTRTTSFDRILTICDQNAFYTYDFHKDIISMLYIRYINNVSIDSIVDSKSSLPRRAFWNIIKRCKNYKEVYLILGYTDLTEIIPKLYDQRVFQGTKECVNYIVDKYVKLLKKLVLTFPEVRFTAFPVEFNQESLQKDSINRIFSDFNENLENRIRRIKCVKFHKKSSRR